jgi:hypothetical protein
MRLLLIIQSILVFMLMCWILTPALLPFDIFSNRAVFALKLLHAFELLEFCGIELEPCTLGFLDHPNQRRMT